MTSARGQIFAEIIARMTALPAVASVELMPPGDPDAYPAIKIFDDGQQIAEVEAGATRYALSVAIEGHVQGGVGDATHAALNDLHAAVIAALLSEPPLGGLAETVEEGGMRVQLIELADERSLAFAQDLTITFATPRGDPTRIA